MIDEYDFNLNHVVSVIKEKRARVVGLQFPDGFRREAVRISDEIGRRVDVRCLISANSCFGACDVDNRLLESVDIMFQFGHARIPNITVENTHFIEVISLTRVLPVIKQAIGMISGRVGLVSTAQFVHTLADVQKYLAEHGITGVIHDGDGRIARPGLVLGCNFSAAAPDCDEYLYVGTGDFHALGVALATKKTVLIADPVTEEVRMPDSDRMIRKRCAAIERSLDAQSIGVIVSTKIGQCRRELAFDLCTMAEEHGLDTQILVMDMVTPDALLSFDLDVFVSTACPRIAIDDSATFPAPVLTPVEFEVVVGERRWEDLVFDEIS
ncbi:MAG TPA: diphthamide biosynthesis enzyme Dph2 [Methanosarcinales archaeon]|nr:diphthamide biosynthesis enzyme Dph2 [Methanosarcinales archaeon]